MSAGERIVGVEGGGTKTAWALVVGGKILESGKLPPSNFRLTSSDQLAKILRVLPREVDRVGIFLAGSGTEEDRTRLIRQIGSHVWESSLIAKVKYDWVDRALLLLFGALLMLGVTAVAAVV